MKAIEAINGNEVQNSSDASANGLLLGTLARSP
jgi:hypothetical protein